MTGKELFEQATYSVEEIVDYIVVRFDTSYAKNNTNIKIKSTDLQKSLLYEHGHRKYGKCFVYRPKKSILALGVYYIKIIM